jgi:hypothetical protein
MLDQLPLLNVFDLGLQQIQGLRQQLWPRLPPAIQTSALGPSNGGAYLNLSTPKSIGPADNKAISVDLKFHNPKTHTKAGW